LKWKERLYVPELAALIKRATDACLSQRQARDLLKQYELAHQPKKRSLTFKSRSNQTFIGMARGRTRQLKKPRRPTIACPEGGMHSMVMLNDGKTYWCPVHKTVQKQIQSPELSLQP
jgi:hypothetical protein